MEYTVLIHPADEGGFWAEVTALSDCYTQGETVEETLRTPAQISRTFCLACSVAGFVERSRNMISDMPSNALRASDQAFGGIMSNLIVPVS